MKTESRWLVWNESYNTYAGKAVGSWTDQDGAKRFRRRDIAGQVAAILTIAGQGSCKVKVG